MSSSQASSIGALDFRRLFEAAPALYLVIAPDLTIIAVSDAYVAALRTTREKILGRGILEAFPDSSQHPFGTSGHSLTASLQNVLESRTPEVMPVQRTRIPALDVPDNHEDRFWTPINTPVVDSSGTVSCIIHRIEDATPVALLKRTQREHEQFGEDQRARLMRLEAEMFNRSEELLEAYRQLQKANATQAALLERIEAQERELQAFSYSVSHDLRAPLRHIAGFIDLLTKHCRNSMDTEGQHYLKAITSSVKGLDILIEDLLNFSLVSHSDLKTTSVDLTNLAQDVVAHLEPLHGGPLTHWTIGDLPSVRGDASMLRVVFVNLISNALKFASKESKRHVEIGSAISPDAAHIVFYVRDNGVGFDMDHAARLFGVFERFHSDQDFEGTGVGLATVRRIIQKHGGRTWAVSAVDHGATFYCSLPTEQPG